MMRTLYSHVVRPLRRLMQRSLPTDDPWLRYPTAVPLKAFGLGSLQDFSWYFEGESLVEVRSVEEIQEWLLGCSYARDPDLFQHPDFWLHPCSFEQLRKGDCEDFSLWAWRKLVRLGFEAEFVAGRYTAAQCHPSGHTWVLFHREGRPFLFDTVAPVRDAMIRPLDEVRDEYLPEVSVNQHFSRFVYTGYLLRCQEAQLPMSASFAPLGARQSRVVL